MAEQQFVIRLGVNSVNVDRGVDAATKSFDKLAKRVGGLFALNAVRGYIQGIIDKVSGIADFAKQLGTAVEFTQSLSFAAEQTGAQLSDLQATFKSLQKSQVDAIKGNDESAAAFMRMGLSIDQLKKLKPEELYRAVGTQLAKLPPSAQVTADAMTLMGKSGVTMLGSFRDGFFDVADGAKAAGQVIDEEIVQKIKSAGDNIKSLGNKLVVALAPGVAKLAEMTGTLFDFINQSVGFAATAAGSFVGGSSFGESLQAGADFVKEEARKSAEAASRRAARQQGTTDASGVETPEEKKKKARAIKENTDAAVDIVDAQARRGVFIGGRGGEITRVPQATLEENRRQTRIQERLHEAQIQVVRNGASMLDELRKLNAEDSRA